MVARALTLAGALPFLLLNIAVALHLDQLDFRLAFFTYAAVIISFICGIHWAAFLFFPDICSSSLLVQSNVITLVGWVSIFSGSSQLTIALQGLCFIYLLRLDFDLYTKKLISQWFFNLRVMVTSLVVFLLGIGWWFL